MPEDRVGTLRIDGRPAVGAVLNPQPDEQQAQKVADFRQRGDGACPSASAGTLFDRHRRRNSVDRVHIRPAGRLHELARIGVERFEIAALPFGEQDVEGHRALAAAAHAGDDREPIPRQFDVDVLEVVFAGPDDIDDAGGLSASRIPCRRRLACRQSASAPSRRCLTPACILDRRHRPLVHAISRPVAHPTVSVTVGRERLTRVAGRNSFQVLRRSLRHKAAALLASFGAEIEDPVTATHQVQVVLDDHDGMPLANELVKGAQQLLHVSKVQAGGGLVEDEQRRFAPASPSPGQVTGQFEPLGLTSRERRHGLSQGQVIQTHRLQGAQPLEHGLVVGEERHGFGDGHLQNVRYGLARAVAPRQLDFQDLVPEAPPAACPAAQVHVAEKLHLDVLESLAGTVRATAVAGIEAEGAGRVAPLPGQGLCRQAFAHDVQ